MKDGTASGYRGHDFELLIIKNINLFDLGFILEQGAETIPV